MEKVLSYIMLLSIAYCYVNALFALCKTSWEVSSLQSHSGVREDLPPAKKNTEQLRQKACRGWASSGEVRGARWLARHVEETCSPKSF